MSVLEAPATWIAAAAVLVVIAVVLIALAPRRRSGAAPGPSAETAETAASAETAPAAPPAAASDPTAAPAAASSSAPVADDDAVTGPVLPRVPRETPREPVRADAGVDDDVRTTEVAPEVPPRIAEPADEPVTAETPPMTARERYVPVTDPARADGRAKDRLLAALLSDPAAAVDVVAAMPENGAPATGSSAAALLRAGLSPAQVAQLCGVEADDLATLVARDLGLLGAARGGAQRERSRTEEPGRAWASAGSAAGSTTPTTG